MKQKLRPSKSTFGTYIRELRLAHGWDQRTLAELAMIDASYYYKIESGIMPAPSDAIMQQLAQVFEVPLATLAQHSSKVPTHLKVLLREQPLLAELLYRLSKKALPEWGYQELLGLVKMYE